MSFDETFDLSQLERVLFCYTNNLGLTPEITVSALLARLYYVYIYMHHTQFFGKNSLRVG